MDDQDFQTLVGLHRAEFDRAEKNQARVLYAQIAITFLSLIAIFLKNEAVVYITSILVMVAALLWVYFYWCYIKQRAMAERGRRVVLLTRGLGKTLSNKEYRDLRAGFTATAEEGKKCEDPNYYENSGEPGYRKLAGMLQESAFWSKHLLSASANRYWYYFIVCVSLFIFTLLVLLPVLQTNQIISCARIVCLMLTLLASTSILGRALAYSYAAQDVSKVYDRLEGARMSENPEHDLLFILGDYNAAVEGAPMFAAGVYKQHSDRLNELWNTERKLELAENNRAKEKM